MTALSFRATVRDGWDTSRQIGWHLQASPILAIHSHLVLSYCNNNIRQQKLGKKVKHYIQAKFSGQVRLSIPEFLPKESHRCIF